MCVRDKQEARTGSELNLEINRIISWQQFSHRRWHTPVHMHLDTHNPHCVALLSQGFFFLGTLSGGKDEAVTRDHREADSSTLGPNLEGILTHSHWRRDAHTGFPIVCQSGEGKAESVAHCTAAGRRNVKASLEATHIGWKPNLLMKQRLHLNATWLQWGGNTPANRQCRRNHYTDIKEFTNSEWNPSHRLRKWWLTSVIHDFSLIYCKIIKRFLWKITCNI